jgi:DNA-binding MarR family transcriptional regulator
MKYRVTPRSYEVAPAGETRQPAQAGLLDLINRKPMTQADMVAETGKGRSTISRQIRQLESAGLVEKMPDGKWKAKGDV